MGVWMEYGVESHSLVEWSLPLLTVIKMKDIESYLCMLREAFGDSNQYDDLKLAVKGNCLCF